MIDGIAPLQASVRPLQPPPAPAPDLHSLGRFQRLLQGEGKTVAATGSGVLRPAGEQAAIGDSTATRLLHAVADMDARYRDIVARLDDWPTLRGYLGGDDPLLGGRDGMAVRHVSNLADLPVVAPEPVDGRRAGVEAPLAERLADHVARLDELQARQSALYAAGIRYQQDTTRWFLRAEFLMSGIKIVTASMRQALNGLKLLFTSQ